MKRVQYHRYGAPDVLRIEEFELPTLKSNQIRIRVEAAAVNPMDWKMRKGEMKFIAGGSFPRGLGHDFAGVVESIGAQVTRFKAGDEVFGATGLKEPGSFAQILVTDEKSVFPKPQFLSFEEAASLPIVVATGWSALVEKANLKSGQQIFISGCLGGVGRVAVQIATMNGAEVVGSCSASNVKEAQALGVKEVVDYRNFDCSKYRGRFDVVFDTHGALSLSQCDTMLKPGGLALHIVPNFRKIFWSLLSPRHKVIFADLTPQSMNSIIKALEQKKITPLIGRTVPLSGAIPAITEFEKTGLPKGKLVISPMQ